MRSVLLLLCFTWTGIPAFSAHHPHPKTIAGRVAVYSNLPACLNGYVTWSMIIRVERPEQVHSRFIRVDFTLPCNKSPEWALTKPSIQKFRLVRQEDCDTKLNGVMEGEPNPNLILPIWAYPHGPEHETLPFGEVLPCYRSVDLPLEPVL